MWRLLVEFSRKESKAGEGNLKWGFDILFCIYLEGIDILDQTWEGLIEKITMSKDQKQ